MKRAEVAAAAALFKPDLARRISLRSAVYMDVDALRELCTWLYTHQVTAHPEAQEVIRRAALMLEQQGRDFRFEESDEMEAQLAERAAKKAKNRAATVKGTTTPILSEEDKARLYKRKLSLGESTVSMMSCVAPWPHKPNQWGSIWHSVHNTRRIVVSMINAGVVEVLNHHDDPMLVTIQRGPRWDEAVGIYGEPLKSYEHRSGMMTCKPRNTTA